MINLKHLPPAVRGVLLLAVVAAAAGALTQPIVAAPRDENQQIVLKEDTMLYGDEAGSKLTFLVKGKPTFDYNGDGLKDFFVSHWTRAFHPQLLHEHLDIVFGRAEWPAEMNISDLDQRLILQLPHPPDALPGDPLYTLSTVTDINADRKDDIGIKKEEYFIREDPGPPKKKIKYITNVEFQFYLGRADPPQFLKVPEVPPDLVIGQSRPPRLDAEKLTTPMPDKFNVADIDGDGDADLLVGSCALVGPGHANNAPGALYIYLGPYGSSGAIDLTKNAPDAIIYSSADIQVCAPTLEDLDGDGKRDLFFTAETTHQSQPFHSGVLVPGRAQWNPVSEVEDLVATRFMNAAPNGDVDFAVRDIDGDKKRDIVGSAWLYVRGSWHEEVQCVWYGGKAYPAEVTTETCDFRFTDKWPGTVVDINGDKALDYIFALDQRSTDPYRWYVKLGPIVAGGSMEVTDDPASADYTISLPYSDDAATWRNANVGGPSADDDFLVLKPLERHSLPDDGHIVITFGPLVAPVITPTSTPGPSETATEVPPPTLTPTITPTAEPPVWTIYLPVSHNREAN